MATISDKPVTKPEKAGQALGDSRGARSAFFVGVMRYRAVCTPAFAARWFPDGVTGAALAAAPVVVYDEKDDLQDRTYDGTVEPPSARGTTSRQPMSSGRPCSSDSAGACCLRCSSPSSSQGRSGH